MQPDIVLTQNLTKKFGAFTTVDCLDVILQKNDRQVIFNFNDDE